MGAKVDILTFEQGLVGPLVEPRWTTANAAGCRRLENMIPLPQGPVLSRPPTQLMGLTRLSLGNHPACRLTRVIYDENHSYLLEFGHLFVKFFADAGQILYTTGPNTGNPVELVTPYTDEMIDDLQVYSDAGTLYITHPDYWPQRIVYTSEQSWLIESCPFWDGPFCDENETDTTITPSAATGAITLTASASLFDAGHLHCLWQLRHWVAAVSSPEVRMSDYPDGTEVFVYRDQDLSYRARADQYFAGTISLQRSTDETNWEDYLTFGLAASQLAVASISNKDEDAWFRWHVIAVSDGQVYTSLSSLGFYKKGIVWITTVDTDTSATADVLDTLGGTTATDMWSQGAWSHLRGFPRGVAIVDNRLSFCGTKADPTTIWQSYTNKYMVMRAGTDPADALIHKFAARKGDPFLWMHPLGQSFFVGTPSALLQISATNPNDSVSPTNHLTILRRIEFGCAAVPPVDAYDSLVYLDATRTRVCYTEYDYQQDRIIGSDLLWATPGLLDSPIKQMAFQAGSIAILWLLREDGDLLSITLDRKLDRTINAPAYHTANSPIESIEVLPGSDGPCLWWGRRGQSVTYDDRWIEKMQPLSLERSRFTDHRLDSFIVFDGGEAQVLGASPEGIVIDAGTGIVRVNKISHGLSNGQHVRFSGVCKLDRTAHPWLNGRVFKVGSKDNDAFTLCTESGTAIDGRLIDPLERSGASFVIVSKTFTVSPNYLAGQPGAYPSVIADGQYLGALAGTAWPTFILDNYYHRVVIGYPAPACVLQPLRVAFALPDGSSKGRQMIIAGLWIAYWQSFEFKVGRDEDHLRVVPVNAPSELEPVQELQTGEQYVHIENEYSGDPTVLIVQDQPFPLGIRAMTPDVGIYGTGSYGK
jgi:hypothetical protein